MSAEVEVDPLVVAVRTLDQAYRHWLRHSEEEEFPPALVSSIGVVCALVTTSFPKDDSLMSLFMACTQLAAAFQDVLNEETGSATRTVVAIENVVKFLAAHETEETVPIQSVSSMLKEHAGAAQRYNWIAKAYGDYDADEDLWRGPFFSRTGIPLQALIEKEAATPGAVLGEDYQPMGQQRKMARIKAAAIKQLSALQAGLFRPEGGAVPEKQTVLEMLQDGQYADVIARVKGVSLKLVEATAATAGIRLVSRDDSLGRAALDASSDPMAEARGYVKPSFGDPDDDDQDDQDDQDDDPYESEPNSVVADDAPLPVMSRMTSEELTDFAVSYLSRDNQATAHEILAAAVTDTGKSASRQMLNPILRTLRGAL